MNENQTHLVSALRQELQDSLPLLKECAQLQAELNDKYTPAWRTEGRLHDRIDYPMAAAYELLAEFLPSAKNFEWWKPAKELDPLNARVELVDALHFILSEMILQNPSPEALKNALSEPNLEQALPDSYHTLELSTALKRCVRSCLTHLNDSFILVDFSILCRAAGSSLTEILGMYRGKNLLNGFRINNGYKQGTYEKVWILQGEAQEDNYWVFQHLIKNPTLSKEEILSFMEDTYSRRDRKAVQ